MSRVSAYLNFPGNTEEAMNFYRVVFRSEFNQPGIRRFSDMPETPDQPPMDEATKKMVLHVELPIVGGFVIMATDAPESMGFTVKSGNQMHLNIEPESREEADRLFQSLSVDGQISMPMTDMFWGAYFGSLTDRYGINWMINFSTR
jgi:PhnB protein